MRKAVLIGSVATVLVAGGATVVPHVGHAARRASLARAAKLTLAVDTQRFASDVEITRNMQRMVLRLHGATAPGVVSVRVLVEARQPDGSVVPMAGGAEVLDGPFLYRHAPAGIAVNGTVHWLRIPVSSLRPTSPALRTLHAMTTEPLLRMLTVAHTTAVAAASGVFRGTLRYDDPLVVAALAQLTNRTQFRDLRFTAVVGSDGFVHRLRLTGRTADRSAKLRVDARLYSFGRPVRLTQPLQRSFLDLQDPRLAT